MTDHNVSPTEGSSDIESRLRHTLAARPHREPVDPPDWGAFAGRLASTTRRRQRLLVGAVALALVAGGAGGYFGDMAASPGRCGAGAPGWARRRAPPRPPGTPARSAPAAGGPAVMCPNEPVAVPGATPATTTTVGPDVNGSGDIGSATRLFIRTTSDGVTVRAYQDAPTVGVVPRGWHPAGRVRIVGHLVVGHHGIDGGAPGPDGSQCDRRALRRRRGGPGDRRCNVSSPPTGNLGGVRVFQRRWRSIGIGPRGTARTLQRSRRDAGDDDTDHRVTAGLATGHDPGGVSAADHCTADTAPPTTGSPTTGPPRLWRRALSLKPW